MNAISVHRETDHGGTERRKGEAVIAAAAAIARDNSRRGLKRRALARYYHGQSSEDRYRDRSADRCPSCRTEIKLTESLAAPLIAETRRKFDQQLAAKEVDFGRREALLKQASEEIAKARETVDEQFAAKLKAERTSIAQAEAKRARLAIADEFGERDRQLADLQQTLSVNAEKLAAGSFEAARYGCG
ncbi:hypothetical protein [Bradyrhizobium guangdongense]